jgi:D-alanine-D-alanine ligase
VPDFAIFPRGRACEAEELPFPLFVKSLTLDASIGISQASVVETDDEARGARAVHPREVGTDALVEQFVDGRELYVGVLGNQRLQTLPIWELLFTKMPEDVRKIATERLKWSLAYQKKHGIVSDEAKDLPPEVEARIRRRLQTRLPHPACSRATPHRPAPLADGRVYVIEANPNPQLSRDEDFATSARKAGIDYPDLIQRIVALARAGSRRSGVEACD